MMTHVLTKHLSTFWMLVLLALPLSVSACGMGEQSPDGYENASIEHAYQHWQQGDKSAVPFVFLDVRTPEEFAEGHIAGALNIPIQTLRQRLNEVPTDKRVYVHCEAGGRSSKAAKLLVKSGITNIEHLPDGMAGWRDAGYPVEK